MHRVKQLDCPSSETGSSPVQRATLAIARFHRAISSLARTHNHWTCRRVADRFDPMTIGVHDEGTVVVGVIMRAKTRHAIVLPPVGKRRRMKCVDSRAVGEVATIRSPWRYDLGTRVASSLPKLRSYAISRC